MIQTTQSKGRIGNYRWFICAMLFAATTINYLDRQILGLLKPTLEKIFSWTESDYSYIVMAFTATYALGQLLYGRVIDHIGTRLGYIISVSIWSIAAVMHAFIRTTVGFGLVRALLGIGESGNYPGGVKTVAEWFPKRERALAVGIFDSGSNIGACVGPILVPFILALYGWQIAFIITGSLGFIWLLVWLFVYEVPARQKKLSRAEYDYIHSDNDVETPSAGGLSWGKLLGLRQTWTFIVGKFFTDPIWYFFLFWLPAYFNASFHLDLKKPSLPLVIVYTGTMIGSIGGGYLSSWLIQKGWPVYKARKIALLVSAIAVVPILITRYTNDMWLVVSLISLSVAANQAWSANIFTIVSDMFPKKAVSSVVGLGGMAGAVGGVLFESLIGYILDIFKASGNIVVGYNIIFLVCGSSFLIAWLIIHWLTPKMEPVNL
ncbi:MFS transporter [Spirosoma aerolatum]|uniref:MFS transporter n=1 Tax=Spirosoma aerolatum TaxID=1211326 RepID=UPI0009AD8FFB|nr:MFS transporter [Spirosoma aerolatum]